MRHAMRAIKQMCSEKGEKERERGAKGKKKEGAKERYTERNKVETQQREREASSA